MSEGLLKQYVIQNGLPDDPYEALKLIVERFKSIDQPDNVMKGGNEQHVRLCADLIALLTAFSDAHGIGLGHDELGGDESSETVMKAGHQSIVKIETMLQKRAWQENFAKSVNDYKALFPTAVVYEFSRDDLAEVQAHVNALREILRGSTELEEPHRARLLKRVEDLQKEVHKRMSSLDGVLGKIVQVLPLVGLLREDKVEAATDALKALGELFWKKKVEAEGLPASLRLPIGDERPRLGKGAK